MIDAFDAAFDQPARPSQPAREYEPAPQGEYVAEIVKAERKRVPWKSNDANPHGDCTVLRLRVGRSFGFVFCDVPDDLRWLARAVAQAVGLDGDELVPDTLVGRRARVTIKNYTSRDGQRKAAVGRWLPPDHPRPQTTTGSDTFTLADAVRESEAAKGNANAAKDRTKTVVDHDDQPVKKPRARQPPPAAPPAAKPSRNAVKRYTTDNDDIPF